MGTVRGERITGEENYPIQQQDVPASEERSLRESISNLFCCCFNRRGQESDERQRLLSGNRVSQPIVSQPINSFEDIPQNQNLTQFFREGFSLLGVKSVIRKELKLEDGNPSLENRLQQVHNLFVAKKLSLEESVEIAQNIFNDFSAYMKEIENHLDQDMAEIKEIFGVDGRVKAIRLSGKETHQGGKCVAFIDFENEKTIVYKPRSVRLDAFLSGKGDKSLFSSFNKIMDKEVVGLVTYLDKKDHGYAEYIQDKDLTRQALKPEQLKETCYNWGAFFALSNIFMIDDLHFENAICIGNKFYFIDLEVVGDLMRLRLRPEEEITANPLNLVFTFVIGSLAYLALAKGEDHVEVSELAKEFSKGYKEGQLQVEKNKDAFLQFPQSLFEDEVRSVIVDTAGLTANRKKSTKDECIKASVRKTQDRLSMFQKAEGKALSVETKTLSEAFNQAYMKWDIPKYTIKQEENRVIVSCEGREIRTLEGVDLVANIRNRIANPPLLSASEDKIASLIEEAIEKMLD